MTLHSSVLVGIVGTQPEYKELGQNKTKLTTFRFCASNRRRNHSGEWETVNECWVTVECWGDLATRVHANLKQKDRAIVVGQIITETYETKDKHKAVKVVCKAMTVGHDLRNVRDTEADTQAQQPSRSPAPNGPDAHAMADPRAWDDRVPVG